MSYTPPFSVPELTYEQALAELHSALRFGIEPLLETVVDMLAELGNPDERFRSIQIAGTNGKSSTSRYAAALLRGEGMRVALYTSPELVSYTERMEIDGGPVSEEAFARGIAYARESGERVNARRVSCGERPYDITEFDLLTVAACVVFAEAEVDVCVLECGLGGRWDATSAVSTIESVAITGIGLDHIAVLGDTLEEIATEKAAIIKRGRTCTLGVGCAIPTSVENVLLAHCAECGVEPVLVRPANKADAESILEDGEFESRAGYAQATYTIATYPQGLGAQLVFDVTTPGVTYGRASVQKPLYQAANITCAISLCEQFLGRALDADRLRESVEACPTPGRFDVVRSSPLTLIDAAHNPQSVRAFLSSVEAYEPVVSERPTLLCAVLADKDVAGIVEHLAPEFPRVVVCATSSSRALPSADLAEHFCRAGREPVHICDTVADALYFLKDEAFIACGSITLAGEVARLMQGD